MDERRMQDGQQWVQTLLRLMGTPATVKADPTQNPLDDGFWLTIDESTLTSEKVQLLIGPDGSVLDSIQYLTNAILNLGQDRGQQGAFTIELDGYRLRRYTELKAMAEQAADHVRQTGQEYELKALSSAERRQVHTMLKAHEDLETYSRGEEPDRRLVVCLLKDKPQ